MHLNAIEQGDTGAKEKLVFLEHFDAVPLVFIIELGNDGLKLERLWYEERMYDCYLISVHYHG